MAARNTPAAKAARRAERTSRKARAARRIPFHGTVVSKKDVIGHRYLAVHGLPFSRSCAAVVIESVSGVGEQS